MSSQRSRAGSWQAELLRRLFLHQNGLAAITALATLESSGTLACLRKQSVRAAEVLSDTPSPSAIAASMLAACGTGWLTVHDASGHSVVSAAASSDADFTFALLLDAHRAVRDADRDGDWADQAASVDRLLGCLGTLSAAKAAVRRRTSMADADAELLVRLLEGILAVPLLPRMAVGYDHATVAPLLTALELDRGEASIHVLLSFFAPMYGLAGSYAQALIRLPDLVASGIPHSPADISRSIDRSLNVRASALAHTGYFHAATGLIARIFDELPVSKQPRAILDVGCGAGTWLRSLYRVVSDSTARGRSMRQYPLHLIGVDLDPVALEISRRSLRDLPATCITGDVGEPAAIAEAVSAASGIEISDVLSVRAFVDHNRALADAGSTSLTGLRLTDGVYATSSGSITPAGAVCGDWAAHYSRWTQACERYGLVVIEAHTLPVADVQARLETSHSLALQYYHALSGQSPIPYTRFHAAAAAAGLVPREHTLYPRSVPTTSINWLVPAAREKSPDMEGI